MTVEEYASACEELSDKFEDDFSFQFDSTEDALSEFRRWNPPEELKEFHETRIRFMEAAINVLKDTGFLELMEDLEKAVEEENQTKVLQFQSELEGIQEKMSEFEDEVSALADEAQRAQGTLSPATRRILEDGDCL